MNVGASGDWLLGNGNPELAPLLVRKLMFLTPPAVRDQDRDAHQSKEGGKKRDRRERGGRLVRGEGRE